VTARTKSEHYQRGVAILVIQLDALDDRRQHEFLLPDPRKGDFKEP
jgi:hypothetical protein